MKLLYIANASIPTHKAHGVAITQACTAFSKRGVSVRLILPRRLDRPHMSLSQFYGVTIPFDVQYYPTIDLFSFFQNRFTFRLQAACFFGFLLCRQLFAPRDVIVYSREPAALIMTFMGFRVFLENHDGPPRRWRRLFFLLCGQAQGIIVTSKNVLALFRDAGFDTQHIVVARNAVDLSVFASTESQDVARAACVLPFNIPILLYTGSFTTMGNDKGIDDVLRMLPHLTNVLFVAVGGSNEDIARYTEHAERAGVLPRCRFIGRLTQQALALYQRAADVLLMPFPDTRHYRESMSPIKMFEYMASGRPIVTTDLPTIREVLSEKEAYFAEPGNPEALAEVIRLALKDQKGAALRAIRARELVSHYTWEERAKTIMSFIEGVR